MKYFIFLVIQDLKERYFGSLLGIFWAFLNPLLTILVMLFVFKYGFKKNEVDGISYNIWFISGFLPWFLFSEALVNMSGSIFQKRYLIKKMAFNIWLIPLIRFFSIFIIFAVLFFFYFLYICVNFGFDIFYFQIFYYIFALFALLMGLGYVFAVFSVFIPDFKEIVSVLLKFLFWVTPVFWSFKSLPSDIKEMLYLNPVVHIVEGFRNTFLYKIPFYEDANLLRFWLFVILINLIAFYLFKKAKDHFIEVL